MTSKLFTVFLSLFFLLGLSSATNARTRTYHDERNGYVLELPSAGWRAVAVEGIAHPRTEFVNGSEDAVVMRIRKVYPAVPPSELVRSRQSRDRLLLPGYILAKQQPFDGQLSGASYTYEYVKGGVPMAGRIYYLQGEDGFVYRIQFTGPQNRMWELREQMDSIAGSFRPEWS